MNCRRRNFFSLPLFSVRISCPSCSLNRNSSARHLLVFAPWEISVRAFSLTSKLLAGQRTASTSVVAPNTCAQSQPVRHFGKDHAVHWTTRINFSFCISNDNPKQIHTSKGAGRAREVVNGLGAFWNTRLANSSFKVVTHTFWKIGICLATAMTTDSLGVSLLTFACFWRGFFNAIWQIAADLWVSHDKMWRL